LPCHWYWLSLQSAAFLNMHKNTLARIQFLQHHFHCYNQYYSRLTVRVRKHTAPLCTVTSVLLLLGVLLCCHQHSDLGLPNKIPYRTGIQRTYQNCGTNVDIRHEICFSEWWEIFFTDTSSSIDSTIYKNAVRCSTYETCLNWVIHYPNVLTILSDFTKDLWHAAGIWTDENNRPLACELEYGVVETSGIVFLLD